MRALRLLPLLLLAGCGKGNFNEAPKGGDDTLVYALLAKNTTLDPGKINDVYMTEVLQNVVEPLVTYGEDNEVVPCLAEKWDVVDGGRTYVFHLRKGVKFSNGRLLVADDFRWCWERVLAPKFASPAAGNYLGSIVGVPDYMAGKANNIAGVKVIDDATLSVTLDKPRPYYLGNLTVPQAAVLAREAAGEKEATRVESVVGTGPFVLAKIVPDAELILNANPGYWNGKPKVARIRRPIVTNPTTQIDRFRAGEFDYLELNRRDALTFDKVAAQKGRLRFEPRAQILFFVLGQKAYAPFRDARVRRAFAMAIDRGQIVRELLAGSTEAKGLVPHGVPGYQKEYAGLEFDPAAARALMAEAGYPEAKGLPFVELDYAGENSRVVVEAVATELQKHLRVKVKPRLLEWGAYLDKQDRGVVQMGFVSWAADYLDPQNFISMQIASYGTQDKEGFKDAQIDALCLRADVEADPKVRADLYRRAERRAIEQAARIPIFMTNQPIMTSPRLQGLRTNALGLMPMTTVRLDGR